MARLAEPARSQTINVERARVSVKILSEALPNHSIVDSAPEKPTRRIMMSFPDTELPRIAQLQAERGIARAAAARNVIVETALRSNRSDLQQEVDRLYDRILRLEILVKLSNGERRWLSDEADRWYHRAERLAKALQDAAPTAAPTAARLTVPCTEPALGSGLWFPPALVDPSQYTLQSNSPKPRPRRVIRGPARKSPSFWARSKRT